MKKTSVSCSGLYQHVHAPTHSCIYSLTPHKKVTYFGNVFRELKCANNTLGALGQSEDGGLQGSSVSLYLMYLFIHESLGCAGTVQFRPPLASSLLYFVRKRLLLCSVDTFWVAR